MKGGFMFLIAEAWEKWQWEILLSVLTIFATIIFITLLGFIMNILDAIKEKREKEDDDNKK